jgi:hypothetical protein
MFFSDMEARRLSYCFPILSLADCLLLLLLLWLLPLLDVLLELLDFHAFLLLGSFSLSLSLSFLFLTSLDWLLGGGLTDRSGSEELLRVDAEEGLLLLRLGLGLGLRRR